MRGRQHRHHRLHCGEQPNAGQTGRDDPSQLKYGVSITDACIGWEETQELLTWTYDKMANAA